MEARAELGKFDQIKLSQILRDDYYKLVGFPPASMCPTPQQQNVYTYPSAQTSKIPATIPIYSVPHGKSEPVLQGWLVPRPPFADTTVPETPHAALVNHHGTWNLQAGQGQAIEVSLSFDKSGNSSWALQPQAIGTGLRRDYQVQTTHAPIPSRAQPATQSPQTSAPLPNTQPSPTPTPRMPLAPIPQNSSRVSGQSRSPTSTAGQKREQANDFGMAYYQAALRWTSS
ncbi:hypothetical protein F5X99DRAFT_40177 [Biscogniauxia marginata]|nr:hypothetical protein F5X99DRAFT_40177 [Biscogniauxia marginata]